MSVLVRPSMKAPGAATLERLLNNNSAASATTLVRPAKASMPLPILMRSRPTTPTISRPTTPVLAPVPVPVAVIETEVLAAVREDDEEIATTVSEAEVVAPAPAVAVEEATPPTQPLESEPVAQPEPEPAQAAAAATTTTTSTEEKPAEQAAAAPTKAKTKGKGKAKATPRPVIRMKGLGKGGAKRHSKLRVTRLARSEYVRSFRKPHIRRLALRGGIGRTTLQFKKEGIATSVALVELLTPLAVMHMQHERIKTLKLRHVKWAAEQVGMKLYY